MRKVLKLTYFNKQIGYASSGDITDKVLRKAKEEPTLPGPSNYSSNEEINGSFEVKLKWHLKMKEISYKAKRGVNEKGVAIWKEIEFSYKRSLFQSLFK